MMTKQFSLEELLSDEDASEAQWKQVCDWARGKFGREPSVESLLFLIGIQSRDGDFAVRLKKEMKQDLIMEGTYEVLAALGIYERREGASDGDPESGHERWVRVRTVPVLSQSDQERLLQIAIARYLARTIPSGPDP